MPGSGSRRADCARQGVSGLKWSDKLGGWFADKPLRVRVDVVGKLDQATLKGLPAHVLPSQEGVLPRTLEQRGVLGDGAQARKRWQATPSVAKSVGRRHRLQR